MVELSPAGWRAYRYNPWVPFVHAGPVRVELSPEGSTVDGVEGAPAASGTIEIGTEGGPVRLRALRTEDAAGGTITDGRFETPNPGPAARVLVAALAALIAGALGVCARRGVIAGAIAVLSLPPAALVLTKPYFEWRLYAEHLRMLHTPASDLRMMVFGASLLPVLTGALLASGLLRVTGKDRQVPPWLALLAAAAVLDVVASRSLSGMWLFAAVPGFGFLMFPWRAVRAGALPFRPVLVRELPVWAVLAVVGWGPGLLPALLWRLLCAWADAKVLLDRAPTIGADAVFVTLALLPVGAEAAIRSTYLAEAWDPVALAGVSLGSRKAPGSLGRFWEDSCGADPRAIYTFGGSSAGGAYQFRGKPSAFFSAVLHDRLCAAGLSVSSLNYAGSGQDSLDAAEAAERLFRAKPPSVVIAYLGVNDILTADSPLTRKQRAQALAQRGEAVSRLDALASSVRTLTGVALLLRPPENAQALVAAVPLADAEENLRRLWAAANAYGGSVLLVPEYTQPEVASKLDGYREMERRLAEELPGVEYIDLGAALGPDGGQYLVDRNHLTQAGSARLAEVLEPAVTALLTGERSVK